MDKPSLLPIHVSSDVPRDRIYLITSASAQDIATGRAIELLPGLHVSPDTLKTHLAVIVDIATNPQ